MKKIFIIGLTFFLVSFDIGRLHNYQCSNCEIVVKKVGFPSTNGCFKKPSHHWHDLGEIGNDSYSCSHCGTVVNCNKFPWTSGCKYGSHHWTKL